MPKKKLKLWALVEDIVKVEKNFLGSRYLVRILGTDEEVWVRSLDLSEGAGERHESGKPLSKQTKARVNRKFAEAQKLVFNDILAEASSGASLSPGEDPIKEKKKLSKWILMAQMYVERMNVVLATDPKGRKEALQQLIKDLKPNKYLTASLSIDRFVDGTFVEWRNKSSVFDYAKGKIGYLTCTVCKSDYKWPYCERAVKHLCSPIHHQNCKAILNSTATTRSQQILNDASKTAYGTCVFNLNCLPVFLTTYFLTTTDGVKLVSLVKDYAVQYCASKSLPFTAAEMALDCISVAFSSIVRDAISPESIATLTASGYKEEVRTHFKYTTNDNILNITIDRRLA